MGKKGESYSIEVLDTTENIKNQKKNAKGKNCKLKSKTAFKRCGEKYIKLYFVPRMGFCEMMLYVFLILLVLAFGGGVVYLVMFSEETNKGQRIDPTNRVYYVDS